MNEQAIVYLHRWNILPRKGICSVADQQASLADGTTRRETEEKHSAKNDRKKEETIQYISMTCKQVARLSPRSLPVSHDHTFDSLHCGLERVL